MSFALASPPSSHRRRNSSRRVTLDSDGSRASISTPVPVDDASSCSSTNTPKSARAISAPSSPYSDLLGLQNTQHHSVSQRGSPAVQHRQSPLVNINEDSALGAKDLPSLSIGDKHSSHHHRRHSGRRHRHSSDKSKAYEEETIDSDEPECETKKEVHLRARSEMPSSRRPGDDDDDSAPMPPPRRHSFATIDQGPKKVDALAFLKHGTPFLKYGRRGYPHFRQFELSADNTKIQWFSKGKNLAKTSIDLTDIDEIRLGQTTPIFERHKAPELNAASFSVIYHNRQRSLDLIAKNPLEYRVWTNGLNTLLEQVNNCRNRSEISDIDNCVVEVPTTPLRVKPPEDTDTSTPARAPIKTKTKQEKQIRQDFDKLKKKYLRLRTLSTEARIYASEHYPRITETLKRVGEAVGLIDDMINGGDFSTADDDIWKNGVDLKGIENMMAVLP